MSWEDHTNELLETNQVSSAIVLGKDDGTIYAQSGTTTISESEAEDFAKYFKGGCSGASLMLGGKKYMRVRYRDDVDAVYMVCKKGGLCAGLSKTLLVIGVWCQDANDKLTAGGCNLETHKKIDAFIEDEY